MGSTAQGNEKAGLLASLGVIGGTDLTGEEEDEPATLEDDSDGEGSELDTNPDNAAKAPELDQTDEESEQGISSQLESSSRKYRGPEPSEQKAGQLAQEQPGPSIQRPAQPDRTGQPAPAAARAPATQAQRKEERRMMVSYDEGLEVVVKEQRVQLFNLIYTHLRGEARTLVADLVQDGALNYGQQTDLMWVRLRERNGKQNPKDLLDKHRKLTRWEFNSSEQYESQIAKFEKVRSELAAKGHHPNDLAFEQVLRDALGGSRPQGQRSREGLENVDPDCGL